MRRSLLWCLIGLGVIAVASATGLREIARLGRQPDGGFIVSSGQRIPAGTIAFDGRPIDLAVHPSGEFFAVLSKGEIFLANCNGKIDGSAVPLGRKVGAGFRGLCWCPDGKRLLASTDKGYLQAVLLEDKKLKLDKQIVIKPPEAKVKENPVPGGMVATRDGKSLYVAAGNRNAVVEVDLTTNQRVREFPVQNLPFEARLSADEKTLIVSNWGGRPPKEGEKKSKSDDLWILVNDIGAAASGTVSLIDRATGATTHLDVGIHPTAIAIDGGMAFVACAMSDSISVIDVAAAKVARTFPIRWGPLRVLGSMPNALAVRDKTLYVCNGGDNALCEIDIPSGEVRGFRPVGFYPVAMALDRDGKSALVLNTKGNGSVAKTLLGKPGNAHDFQGTVSVVDLTANLATETERVAQNNHWGRGLGKSNLKVYNGAIKHVIYIIKENRTYDEVFGDLPMGDGDAKLCSLGERVMPNHRKLAKEFVLFDNGYCSGTNSADGHAWSTQSIANDYLEHFYVGYSRTYPDDGDCAMSYSNGGAIWDSALKAGKSVRVWGEYCDAESAKIDPMPKDWFEVWEDRKTGANKFKFTAVTLVPALKNLIQPDYLYWPLWQSDQHRADIFIRDFERMSKTNTVPNLMVISLPCDHGEGVSPKYPTPRAMMADNDLGLGRIIEAVTKSPQWRETCIFVTEDDAQSGPDHVDGHRTVFMAISPYSKRGIVDSTLYTQTNMMRSIGMMLGLEPLNKFDAYADPMENCFSDVADPRGYRRVENNIALDERNPSGNAMTPEDRFWLEKSLALDWSHLDGPDPYWLNRIHWYSYFKGSRPYPARPGERPASEAEGNDE